VEKLEIQCEHFFVDTELGAKARKWNFRIAEKGVRHYPRTAGETKVQASDVGRTLREIARMWRRIYLPRRRDDGAAAAAQAEAIEVVPARAGQCRATSTRSTTSS
jgi:hypothetical protein